MYCALLYWHAIIWKLMFTLASQANYYSCVILAYIIQIPQRFCAKYFLQNLKIFFCTHFIAQNVQEGLNSKTPNQCVFNGNTVRTLAVRYACKPSMSPISTLNNTEHRHIYSILKTWFTDTYPATKQKRGGVYQNSVKSILYKNVVTIEWCRLKLHRNIVLCLSF